MRSDSDAAPSGWTFRTGRLGLKKNDLVILLNTGSKGLKMATPREQKRFGDSVSPEFLAPELIRDGYVDSSPSFDSPAEDLTAYINYSILQSLPNDLTRMIYLASLRDCNSGLYLHPELSQQRGVHTADRAFRYCHEEIFRRLLTTRLQEYVQQLQEYIRYTRGETITMLKTWKSLQAYRATVPVGAPAPSSELFFLNLSIALEILSQENSPLQTHLVR